MGWVRASTPEARWSLLCQCQRRGIYSRWEELQRRDGHQRKKSNKGEEKGSIQQLKSPQGEDGCWHTQGSVGSSCIRHCWYQAAHPAPLHSCSHRVLGLCMHSVILQCTGFFIPTVLFIFKMILQTISLRGRKRQTLHLYKIQYWNKHHYQSSVANVTEGSDCHGTKMTF